MVLLFRAKAAPLINSHSTSPVVVAEDSRTHSFPMIVNRITDLPDLFMRIIVAGLIRAAILIACFFYAGCAFADGGTCPPGANYLNSTGQLVTLATLGVTNCYFIAADGSDSSTGTDEAHPWLHSPGMANCTNNCAVVQTSMKSSTAGLGFIFRGGDAWHFGNNKATPYAGLSATCMGSNAAGLCLNSYKIATSSNYLYYGVDLSWYSGGSWARPILTGDNPATTSTVSSCPYQLGVYNALISVASTQYYILDNFELTGMCQSQPNNGTYNDRFVLGDNYVVANASTNDIFEHLYVHGWSNVQFSCSHSNGLLIGLCYRAKIFSGGNDNFIQVVIDGSDSVATGWQVIYTGGYNWSQSVWRYVVGTVVTDFHSFHDNLLEYMASASDGQAHGNVFKNEREYAGNNVFYNNLLRHICANASYCPQGVVNLWFWPTVGYTDYIFNNVEYDVGAGSEYFNIGQHEADQGLLAIFNNTFEAAKNNNLYGWQCSNGQQIHAHPFAMINNLYIADVRPYPRECPSAGSAIRNELQFAHSQAKARGYTQAQTYAYSPSSNSSPTVGKGTNETAAYCNALLASSDPLLQEAGRACQSDATYACTYNSINHTVSCPARTGVPRPAGVWDVGAYQFGSTPSSKE